MSSISWCLKRTTVIGWYSKFYPKKIIQKKLSTNKWCKKYYPKVLSEIVLSEMYATYDTSLYFECSFQMCPNYYIWMKKFCIIKRAIKSLTPTMLILQWGYQNGSSQGSNWKYCPPLAWTHYQDISPTLKFETILKQF